MKSNFYKQRIQKILVILSICISAIPMYGCFKRLTLDDLPNEREILNRVNEICDEEYVYIDSTVNETESGIRYDYETARGFTFYVKVNIMRGEIASDTYAISDSYADAVRTLYKDEVNEIIQNNPLCDEEFLGDHYNYYVPMYITSYEDLVTVSELASQLNTIWKEELSFTQHTFPLARLCIYWEDMDRKLEIMQVDIDGTVQENILLESLQNTYIALYQDGEILTTSGIPEQFINENRILKNLYPVKLNQVTENSIKVFYDFERQTYVVNGIKSLALRTPTPWYLLKSHQISWSQTEEWYPKDENYEDTFKSVTIEWETMEHQWKMTYGIDRTDDGDKKIVVMEKDGVETDEIEFIDLYPDVQTRNGLYYALPIDDYCKIFDLTYEIDMEKGSVSFQSIN